MEENEDDNFTVADCVNYDDVKDQIVKSLTSFIERPAEFEVEPRIYHVDVAAMYPNIILTNRLQPVSIVNDTICSSCIFNDPENRCKRDMEWEWRVDYFPASRGDITRLRNQLETEVVTHKDRDGNEVSSRYFQLPQAEKNNALKERIKKYCRTSYKKVKETANVVRKDTVCMRENPFYVDTVERFRNRRMEHKRAAGDAQKKRNEATNNGDLAAATEAAAAYIVSDSLQLAHKCILNSFYGYVMRKAARWYSMEMAGIGTIARLSLLGVSWFGV
jgi:DNA polymerase epsilon subunit 1